MSDMIPYLRDLIGKPVHFRVVIDASIVYSELLWILEGRNKPEARTKLQELIDSGTIIAYAPYWLENELKEHFAEISRKTGVSEKAVRLEWFNYRERIQPHDPKGSLPKKVSMPDEDDHDYAVTFSEVAANAIYTEDKGFSEAGFPTVDKEIVIYLHKYSRESVLFYSISYGGVVIASLTGTAIEGIIKSLPMIASTISRLPAAVKIIFVLSLFVIIANPSFRKKAITFFSRIALEAAELLDIIAAQAQDRMQRALEGKHKAEEALNRITPNFCRAKAPVWRQALMILREQKELIATEKMATLILDFGYVTRAKNFVDYVQRVLREKPYFVQIKPRIWALREWYN